MQLFGQACIFTYSKPKTNIVFLTSYIDTRISLLSDNNLAIRHNNSVKLVSDHPNLPFILNKLTKVPNLVKFVHPGYKGFSTYSRSSLNALGSAAQSL